MHPPALTPLSALLKSRPELQAGQHMHLVGENLVSLAKSNPDDAHMKAMSIMAGAEVSDPKLAAAAFKLAQVPGRWQRNVAGALMRYNELPESPDADELPDSFDLMGNDPLNVLVDMSSEQEEEMEDINSITDAVMNLSREEQKQMAHSLLAGTSTAGLTAHFFPLGVEI